MTEKQTIKVRVIMGPADAHRMQCLLEAEEPPRDVLRVASLIAQFQESYQKFRVQRNVVFGTLPIKKTPDETNAQFCLRIAPYGDALAHEQPDESSCLRQACDSARSAARTFLTIGQVLSEDRDMSDYMQSEGFCELANAFLFAAPLDAANWLRMHPKDYKPTVRIDNWGIVIRMLMVASGGTYFDFLHSYAAEMRKLADGVIKEDPFPSKDMAFVMHQAGEYDRQQMALPVEESDFPNATLGIWTSVVGSTPPWPVPEPTPSNSEC